MCEESPRTLAARGLADAVVKAVELGDDVVAEAAAKALFAFVQALREVALPGDEPG